MLLIKNAKIIVGEFKNSLTNIIKDLELVTDLLIVEGKIKKISKNINIENSTDVEIIDAKFNYVIPGIIDVHTHMRDPGLTHKEDFISGSKACAKGGITTFLDMPNTSPATTTIQALKDKKANCLNRSYVDYGFHFGASNLDNSDDILKISNEVASTKVFLNHSTGNMYINNNNILENIFSASKIITVHAEGEKINLAAQIAKKYSKPLYVCHVSSTEELNNVKLAKNNGVNIFCEVSPHHLFLNDNIKNNSQLNSKLLNMKPELKKEVDNYILIEALSDGTISTIGTDHAPHTLDEKINNITFGIPGVESSLGLMLNLVKSNKITLYRLIQLMSSNPASIFNIKNKGFIKEGYDADLVIIDLNNSYTINNNNIVSKCNWTAYEGFSTGGKILKTILRGNIIYNDGIFTDKLQGKEIIYIN